MHGRQVPEHGSRPHALRITAIATPLRMQNCHHVLHHVRSTLKANPMCCTKQPRNAETPMPYQQTTHHAKTHWPRTCHANANAKPCRYQRLNALRLLVRRCWIQHCSSRKRHAAWIHKPLRLTPKAPHERPMVGTLDCHGHALPEPLSHRRVWRIRSYDICS